MAPSSPPPTLKPGQRLVRAWRGQTHSVIVVEGAFEYQDQRYRSLSEIACQITGDPNYDACASLAPRWAEVSTRIAISDA